VSAMGDAERERELLRAALVRTPECPDIEALAASEPAPAVQQHAASCERCRAELALLHQFETAEPSADETQSLRWVEEEITRRREASAAPVIMPPAVKTPTRDWFRGWRALTWLGACAAVAVVLTVYQRPGDTGATIGSGSPVYRSTQVTAMAPAGDLNAAPAEFRWEPVQGAADYHLRLLQVDGTVLWESHTAGTSLAVPEKIATHLAPARAFQWDVTALDAAGGKLGSSALQSFHILATHR
jgi:hypothetical protein